MLNQFEMKILETEKNNIKMLPSEKLTDEETNKILEAITEELSLPKPSEENQIRSNFQAIAILAYLFQSGGTTNSCNGQLKAEMFDRTIELQRIRKILKNLGLNKSMRKLARTLQNDIHAISTRLELPGNLFRKIKRMNPNLTISKEESYWLSDFQANNSLCPINLRNLINESFKEIKETSTISRNKNKPNANKQGSIKNKEE